MASYAFVDESIFLVVEPTHCKKQFGEKSFRLREARRIISFALATKSRKSPHRMQAIPPEAIIHILKSPGLRTNILRIVYSASHVRFRRILRTSRCHARGRRHRIGKRSGEIAPATFDRFSSFDQLLLAGTRCVAFASTPKVRRWRANSDRQCRSVAFLTRLTDASARIPCIRRSKIVTSPLQRWSRLRERLRIGAQHCR